jgi:antitoxin VapB
MTVKTKLFKSNKTQAVRLPKAVAFPDDVQEVEIVVEGNTRVIRPITEAKTWDDFFSGKYRLSDDYPSERDQGPPDKRRKFFEE